MNLAHRKSHKLRTDNTHRLLYYLQMRTSHSQAEWRNVTLKLFFELYEIRRDNAGIFLWVRAVDGISIYLDTQSIADLQIAQKHILVNAGPDSPLLDKGDSLFGKSSRHSGSGHRQWKIRNEQGINKLLQFIRRFPKKRIAEVAQSRSIPQRVRELVWERDGGRCYECQSTANLHFDHVIPFSKSGSSTDPKNIRLLCAKHNLEQSASMKF